MHKLLYQKEEEKNIILDINEDNDTTNEEFDPTTFFTNKELMYYRMVNTYFQDKCPIKDIEKMVNIINSKSEMSLRVLDWFVTRYSKKKIDINNNNNESFDVRISYKAHLKSYKKRYFDPFRRRKKFYFVYNKNNKNIKLYTTLGQLNFFKWAISNNIIDYVEKNINDIIKAMNQSNKDDKKKKELKNKMKLKKKENIQVKATKLIENDELQLIVNFN